MGGVLQLIWFRYYIALSAAMCSKIPAVLLVTKGHIMTASVTVTERAAKRIAQIVANEPENNMLRVSVEGGGCSGFEYRFDLVPNVEPQDILIERAGAKVLVDSLSLTYLAGSEIDYADDLMSASFKIKNPNATAACGCGTSFSV
jgi:iron-sulfur cluster assembly accessory protein